MSNVLIGLFDFNHILILAFFFLFLWGAILLCKKKGEGFAKKFVLVLLWANFAVHFLKILNPFYYEHGWLILLFIAPNNLCSIMVLAAPFLFLFGKNLGKEYLVIMSILGGAIGLLFPTMPLNAGEKIQEFWTFLEMIRYCFCHEVLLISAALILYYRFHEINYRRLPMDGVMFLFALSVIFLNKLVFWKLLNPDPWYLFFDSEFENPSYVFGIPNRLLDQPILSFVQHAFIYPFLTYSLPNGTLAFIPILWIVPTLYLLLLPLLFVLVYLPIDRKRIRKDLLFLLHRRKKEPNEAGK